MKEVILGFLLMPVLAYGQVFEGFESGVPSTWIQSPEGRWMADSSGSISGAFSLHHCFDNAEAGTDCLGLPLKGIQLPEGNARWSFLLRHGYDPSSSNNWSVFLVSDKSPPGMATDEGISGFALGVNLSGYDDTLRLWKLKSGSITPVLSCGINWQTEIGTATAARIVVERSIDGKWSVEVTDGNSQLSGKSAGTDPELFPALWFGIRYRYTSSRDRLLWIDDVSIDGVFRDDREPPEIKSCTVSGRKSLKITLNERSSEGFAEPDNFLLNQGENKTVSVDAESELTYIAEFASEFENGSLNKLEIISLCDLADNCTSNKSIEFTAAWPEAGEVVITEIMADPLPAVSLPEREYMELSNRSIFPVEMIDWKLVIGSQQITLPAIYLKPSGSVILCHSQDTILFRKFGKVAGLKQFPSLNDGGALVCLLDNVGTLIHGVEYSDKWYGDELKAAGGWSLEMTDTDFPFNYGGNWTASISRKGGTPGQVNSVAGTNPDMVFTGIENVFPADSLNISITFSEPVIDLKGLSANFKNDGQKITVIRVADLLMRRFTFSPDVPLREGKEYRAEVAADLTDFAGNCMKNRSFVYGLPQQAEAGDITFNELMFNPLAGDPDYIEFYNSSGKIINAARLILVSVNDATGDTSQVSEVSTENRCIMPGSFFVITTAKNKLLSRFSASVPENVFEVPDLPSMPDDKGHLILFNRELDIIDEVKYMEEMHFSLLENFEGKALEKSVAGSPSMSTSNWHTAAESQGWGTPGYLNSGIADFPETAGRIELSSDRITPNGDGNDDLLAIRFNLAGTGNIISVAVYDEMGYLVRKVANNLLIGKGDSVTWDGCDNDRNVADTGIYVILITWFNDSGKTGRMKKVCTVIRS